MDPQFYHFFYIIIYCCAMLYFILIYLSDPTLPSLRIDSSIIKRTFYFIYLFIIYLFCFTEEKAGVVEVGEDVRERGGGVG